MDRQENAGNEHPGQEQSDPLESRALPMGLRVGVLTAGPGPAVVLAVRLGPAIVLAVRFGPEVVLTVSVCPAVVLTVAPGPAVVLTIGPGPAIHRPQHSLLTHAALP